MDAIVLKQYCTYLKVKYVGIVQDIKLEYCTDDEHIILNLIRIRKPMRNIGWGSIILEEIVRFADLHNVQIRLYATNVYGSDLQRLYKYYQKYDFILIENDNDGHMIYYPKNISN